MCWPQLRSHWTRCEENLPRKGESPRKGPPCTTDALGVSDFRALREHWPGLLFRLRKLAQAPGAGSGRWAGPWLQWRAEQAGRLCRPGSDGRSGTGASGGCSLLLRGLPGSCSRPLCPSSALSPCSLGTPLESGPVSAAQNLPRLPEHPGSALAQEDTLVSQALPGALPAPSS